MTKVLYLDCFSGRLRRHALGAWLDAGLPLPTCAPRSASLGVDDYAVSTERVLRSGISATRWVLDERVPADAVPAQDGGHAHPHRHVAQIERLIAKSALAPASRDRAIALVRRLASIEAEIHQTRLEDVHLHEVGALDSILDIVGGVFALEWFGADRIVASPLNLGGGTVRCAHGTLPVPAPATARLVQGVPVYADGRRWSDHADRRTAGDRLRHHSARAGDADRPDRLRGRHPRFSGPAQRPAILVGRPTPESRPRARPASRSRC